jgi:tryptophanyl-tRNA synthetase
MTMEEKKMLFSGVQPSGIVTIGNYIGAIKNWVKLQNDYDCIFSIVDLHAITVRQEPAKLRANTLELLALYIASGIDPEKSTIFIQSHVPAHTELCWILNTIAYPGELSRMTQFKDKSKKNYDNINMGLMDYPVLMAADILLYQTELVPVGADQKQHLELSRDLAMRFNNRYSDTFKVPEPYISKHGAKIMSLTEPSKKMSKSDDNINGFISMSDDYDTIIRKFKKATTDSDNKIIFDKEKAGISNLLTIYSAFSGVSIKEAEKVFENKGYGDFKLKVGEAVADSIKPIISEKERLLKDKAYLNSIINSGADKAARIAYRTLNKVYRKMGLYIRERN